MKAIIAFCVCFLAAMVVAKPDQYTTQYDDVDVDEIMANPKLRQNYVDCLLEVGKCTPEGKELKAHIKEAMENECAKCNDVQKEKTKKVIKYMVNHDKPNWQKLCDKYDPDGKFSKKFEKELAEIQE